MTPQIPLFIYLPPSTSATATIEEDPLPIAVAIDDITLLCNPFLILRLTTSLPLDVLNVKSTFLALEGFMLSKSFTLYNAASLLSQFNGSDDPPPVVNKRNFSLII